MEEGKGGGEQAVCGAAEVGEEFLTWCAECGSGRGEGEKKWRSVERRKYLKTAKE